METMHILNLWKQNTYEYFNNQAYAKRSRQLGLYKEPSKVPCNNQQCKFLQSGWLVFLYEGSLFHHFPELFILSKCPPRIPLIIFLPTCYIALQSTYLFRDKPFMKYTFPLISHSHPFLHLEAGNMVKESFYFVFSFFL